MIVTAGTLEESREALALAKSHPNLYSTVGVHPTRCSEFFGGDGGGDGPEAHVAALAAILEEGKAADKVLVTPRSSCRLAKPSFCCAHVCVLVQCARGQYCLSNAILRVLLILSRYVDDNGTWAP